jgi:ferredoxin
VPANTVPVVVRDGETETTLAVPRGSNLRRELLAADLSPYTRVTRHLNCGGRGLCATCGVRITEGTPDPDHWHDVLAARFGYPRLSCQVTVDGPMTVEVPGKLVWGGRE